MTNDIGRRVPGVPEKIWTIVPGERIGLEHVGERMECGRGESFLINIGECAHRAAISYAQKVKVVRMPAILAEKRNCI